MLCFRLARERLEAQERQRLEHERLQQQQNAPPRMSPESRAHYDQILTEVAEMSKQKQDLCTQIYKGLAEVKSQWSTFKIGCLHYYGYFSRPSMTVSTRTM